MKEVTGLSKEAMQNFFKANLELIFFFRSTKRNAKKELFGPPNLGFNLTPF